MTIIIVEGPDGAGKSRFAKTLSNISGISIQKRDYVDSIRGPLRGFDWIRDDVFSWKMNPNRIYDRHPLISEYIYARFRPDGKVRDGFDTDEADVMLQYLAISTKLIICLPPLETVLNNIEKDEDTQAEWVTPENIAEIWRFYEDLANTWPGTGFVYDYTKKEKLV